MKIYDRIIIGGGLFGLYSAFKSAEKGLHVLLLEKEKDLFLRASHINQARIHCGMHYLRAADTAKMCAKYYYRFVKDHQECINNSFKAIYANSTNNSLVTDSHFKTILESLGIPFQYIETPPFLNNSSVSVCAEVAESSFDSQLLLLHYLKGIKKYQSLVDIHRGEPVDDVRLQDGIAIVNNAYKSAYILNCTYASLNNVIGLIKDLNNTNFYKLRYELCEIVLCSVDESIKEVGLTIMDGPFFSIMPFGKGNYHSLTSVGHTPLYSSDELIPRFPCQNKNCLPQNLGLCEICKNRPSSSFAKMKGTFSMYLNDNLIQYVDSLYTIKPILKSSEFNDSRPTVITQHMDSPQIYSVLSGKISSIYELDSIL